MKKYLIILLVVILIVVLYYHNKLHNQPIDVEPELLHSILKPGFYKGNSIMSKTNLFPNGLRSLSNTKITKNNKNIDFEIDFELFDLKTNKKINQVKRIGSFYYKSNHGNKLYRRALSYINNNLVSNINGHVIKKTNNSIEIYSTGTWYTSSINYKSIYTTIENNNNNLLYNFNQFNKFGFIDFNIIGQYNLIKHF